mmetsp:Transcript_24066/g.48716  ORF Transcript_24066/g.48716 Transcript_24066/m.48716 type:complete len:249 (+) Transcript_24066:126-872(+)
MSPSGEAPYAAQAAASSEEVSPYSPDTPSVSADPTVATASALDSILVDDTVSSSFSVSESALTSSVKSKNILLDSLLRTATRILAPLSSPASTKPSSLRMYFPQRSATRWICSRPLRLAPTSTRTPYGSTRTTVPTSSCPTLSVDAGIFLTRFATSSSTCSGDVLTSNCLESRSILLTYSSTASPDNRDARFFVTPFFAPLFPSRSIPLTIFHRPFVSAHPTPHSKNILGPVVASSRSHASSLIPISF